MTFASQGNLHLAEEEMRATIYNIDEEPTADDAHKIFALQCLAAILVAEGKYEQVKEVLQQVILFRIRWSPKMLG